MPMAIFHLEAKVISRGSGRSAAAAAAYMSCSRITNDYDGITHDYTKKKGLVWEKVYLPPNAPPEWKDRAVLWNAVEAAEKTKDSRLARELIVALPVEFAEELNTWLIDDFIENECVSKGMCADVCYHDTDGHNPHAHILLTVRPLNKDGTWQAKTQKEYLCVRNGEECGFTASEYRAAERDGWEKQYLYKVGEKKKYLPPSQAEGLERVNKYPKATRYGRQNPISERWNSEEQLQAWRKAWAYYINRELDSCELPQRVDHRSFAKRGIRHQPTVHEGVIAVAVERKGLTADRRYMNRQIREDNQLVNDLLQTIEYLAKTVGLLIAKVAGALESLRVDMLVLTYKTRNNRGELNRSRHRLKDKRDDLTRYKTVIAEIPKKNEEIDAVQRSIKRTPSFMKNKHKELSAKFYGLSEDIGEMYTEKHNIEFRLKCSENDIPRLDADVANLESYISELQKTDTVYEADIDAKATEYRKIEADNEGIDKDKLREARKALRPAKDDEASKRIADDCYRFDEDNFYYTQKEVAELLDEEPPKPPQKQTAFRTIEKPQRTQKTNTKVNREPSSLDDDAR